MLTDMQTHEIRARTGFFNRSVTCRFSENGMELVQDRDVKRIGYDKLSEIRFHRRGAGRSVLRLKTSQGDMATLRLMLDGSSDRGIDDFVKSFLQRVAQSSPQTPVVIGPSRLQWLASWIGVVASGAILLLAAWSLLVGGQIGALLMPVGIALVNLVIVVPILRSGPTRHYTVADAPAALD